MPGRPSLPASSGRSRCAAQPDFGRTIEPQMGGWTPIRLQARQSERLYQGGKACVRYSDYIAGRCSRRQKSDTNLALDPASDGVRYVPVAVSQCLPIVQEAGPQSSPPPHLGPESYKPATVHPLGEQAHALTIEPLTHVRRSAVRHIRGDGGSGIITPAGRSPRQDTGIDRGIHTPCRARSQLHPDRTADERRNRWASKG